MTATAAIWELCGAVVALVLVLALSKREPKSITVSDRKSAELREKADHDG